jgi:septum site-determining protein MinC
MNVTVSVRPQPVFSFGARSLLAFVLSPQAPLKQWLADLDLWLARSPGFFATRPVMLDLTGLDIDRSSYEMLIADLVARGVRIMAVEGADPSCLDVGLPPLVTGARPAKVTRLDQEQPTDARCSEPPPKAPSLIVDAPVRSGQSIFYPDGDVTVLRSVASGAEIIAGGSIHIYGTLRGRAIAGVDGLPGARIFCRRFEAELVSIAGTYKTADEMEPNVLGRSVQARLAGKEVTISALD